MLLERRVDRFERESPELVQARARANLNLILANKAHLLKVRNGQKLLSAALDFDAILRRGDTLTAGQMSYVEGILESMWSGAGYESVNVHHDKPKGQLRHPKN